MNSHEDLLICDLAETYGIFHYKEFKPSFIATLTIGLKGDSRLKKEYSNTKYDSKEYLLAHIVDNLSIISWQLARCKGDKPKLLINIMNGNEESNSNIQTFNTPEEFEKARQQIIERSK